MYLKGSTYNNLGITKYTDGVLSMQCNCVHSCDVVIQSDPTATVADVQEKLIRSEAA